MNITKESEESYYTFTQERKYKKEVLNWWNKQGKKMQSGLTFIHIDEVRSYKGLTFREIESIYKQYSK